MIDPLHSLAFSVQANPGVYAVLVGSGVSRSAQIPTGWEITLDLVRKLGELVGEDCGVDPALWYKDRYSKAPDYSDLLDALAKTPAERQQLIRAYLEPTDEEREEGRKAPTAAHQAIASLAAKGYIRIIITTNFDRLIELALAEAGVVPTVLSSSDQVHGSLPLIHTRCCVIKVHGDYLDTRILNTSAELERYQDEFNDLLDRIFDDFGMIVCGWSAEWDPALRAAIERTVSRRFSHFWAARGEPSNAAQDLIMRRQAIKLPISDADSFFSELERMVVALEQFSRPHPLSTDAAVASLKGYLTEPKHRIRLADLVTGEVDRVIKATSGPEFALQGSHALDTKAFTSRMRAYDAASETLVAMAATGGFWVEDWHYAIWQAALTRLTALKGEPGLTAWLEARRYPATQLLYALGLGAIEAGDRGLLFIGALFSTPIHREHKKDKTAVELLPPFCLFGDGAMLPKLLEGMGRRHAPLNDWLLLLMQKLFPSSIISDSKLTLAFDKLEILIALSFAFHAKREKEWYWAPPGCYGFRSENRDQIMDQLRSSLTILGDDSPYVKSRTFGLTAEECIEGLESFATWTEKLSRQWW